MPVRSSVGPNAAAIVIAPEGGSTSRGRRTRPHALGRERCEECTVSDYSAEAPGGQASKICSRTFPEGIAFDGIRFNRTVVTAPLFSYLAPSEGADEKLVSPEGIDHGKARPKAEAVWLMSSGPKHSNEVRVVSPEGIDHGKARPKAEAVWLMSSGPKHSNEVRVVSPEGIEPSTNRLRVCCSAS